MTRTLAWLRLVRLPNVFTALADVSAGLIIARLELHLISFVALPLASACFYFAGMAWNDYFDRTIDAHERPQRPIPSGEVSARAANRLATLLAIAGFLLAGLAGWNGVTWSPSPIIHAIILILLILAYNAQWKATAAGPLLMGICRFVNILLGFSAASNLIAPWGTRIAAGVILAGYVIGITIFARNEAGTSQRSQLRRGHLVMLVSVVAIAVMPALSTNESGSWAVYGALGFSFFLLWRVRPALEKPSPVRVQEFVKTAIMGIIVFDACLAMALAGPIGMVVVVLLIPALLVGRWIYST